MLQEPGLGVPAIISLAMPTPSPSGPTPESIPAAPVTPSRAPSGSPPVDGIEATEEAAVIKPSKPRERIGASVGRIAGQLMVASAGWGVGAGAGHARS